MNDLRLLTPGDEPALRALLLRAPLYNLFMIGNLETMGLGAENLFYWGQFSSRGELLGVAMRYRVNWCFYAPQACDWRPLARLVDEYPESQVINGHPDQVQPILDRLERYAVRELHSSYYCRLSPDTTLPLPAWPTRQATEADVPALVELYATAGIMRQDADSLRRKLQKNHVVVTEDGGQIVSAALTSTETSSAAMIGGVFTPEPWRNRGYASAALARLCADLRPKASCLFYDNPAAGVIYRRLGFEDLGPWSLVFLTGAGQ
jgi:predicted GNAT family acetyltransferase